MPSVAMKTLDGVWRNLVQPYIMLSPRVWTPLTTMNVRVPDDNTWKEVWPGVKWYVWTGDGYNLNMYDLFGRPTRPGSFIFVNQGRIGGPVALDTGVFPAGSKLLFVNQGTVAGQGGKGGWFNKDKSQTLPGGGGAGLVIRNYVTIFNDAGFIRGGGGGGAAAAEWGGSNDNNAPGGGGAGWPPGAPGDQTWRPGFTYVPSAATELTPGQPQTSEWWRGQGIGGYPGQASPDATKGIGSTRNMMQKGAPAGNAITGASLILGGSTGLGSDRVIGPWA